MEAEPEPPSRFRLPTVPRDQTRARVLLYHRIGWGKLPRPGVTPKDFAEQLDWLVDNEVEVVRTSELVAFLDGELELPAKVAVIQIDDGERNGFTRAFPALRERNMPFTLAIVSKTVQEWRSHGTLQWSEIREMVDSGLVEIASHSHTHPMLTRLSTARAKRELLLCRELIERHVGVRPTTFVYPYGAHSDRVRRLTEQVGYAAGFAASGAPVVADTDHFRIPRYSVEADTSIWIFASYFRHGTDERVGRRTAAVSTPAARALD